MNTKDSKFETVLRNVSISEVKNHLGFDKLLFKPILDEKNNPTDYIRFWDNDRRILLDAPVIKSIDTNDTFVLLKAIGEKQTEKGVYTSYFMFKSDVTIVL